MSQVADQLLRTTLRPAPTSRRWIVTPVCISILAHLLVLSSVEGLGLLKTDRSDEPVRWLFTLEAGTVSPDDLVGVAIAPDLEGTDFRAVSDSESLVARMFPNYRDGGPREAPDRKPAPRYPEEELPLAANTGLSERSHAFVRDGELGVIDPGKARIAYFPQGRNVERRVADVSASPKLADTPDAFLKGLPGGEPGFLGDRRAQPAPPLDPPSADAVGTGPAATTLGRNAERLLADDGPAVPVKPVELDVKIDVCAEPGSKYHFFKMTVGQRKGTALPVIAKNVLFVIDISASIRLDMLRSIRRAIGSAAVGFNKGDHFNVVRFSEQHYKEFDGFAPATADNIALAMRGVRKEPGQVRTDVYTVLKDVVANLRMNKKDAQRPTNIVVISDGNPTTGMQDIRHIVNDLSAVTRTNYSIFAVNPGAETANAYLLDLLAYRNRGRFVRASDAGTADATILGLLMKHKKPVLMNIRAQYGNFEADEVYPETLPNLYAARPIVIYGRCLPGDTIAVRIMGDGAAGRRKFLYTSTLPEVSTDDKSIVREWARGKIHHLVSLIAREGEKPEVLDEMRQLSERYKLASPFK